jgi:hypothetical protein
MRLDDMTKTLRGRGQVPPGGLQAGMTEQLLELDHVRPGF